MQEWFNIYKPLNMIHHINRMKENHVNRHRNAFDKVTTFMIKTPDKLGTEKNLPQYNKGHI